MIDSPTTEMIQSSLRSSEPNRAEFDGVGEENQTTDLTDKEFLETHGLPWDSENL